MIKLLGIVAIFGWIISPVNIFATSGVPIESELYLSKENQVTKIAPQSSELSIVGGDSFLAQSSPLIFESIGRVKITAYSSTPDQTDDTPFTMASGKHVYDGAIAANFLPLGTKVRIPEIFGDKVFTVEDRMNKRFQDRMDIWMESRVEALNFGMNYLIVEVAK